MRKKLNYYNCCCYYYYYCYYYYWTFGAPNLKYIAMSAYKLTHTYIFGRQKFKYINSKHAPVRVHTHPPTHTPTPTPAHTCTHTYTHLDTHGHLRAGGLKRKFSKRERLSRKT